MFFAPSFCKYTKNWDYSNVRYPAIGKQKLTSRLSKIRQDNSYFIQQGLVLGLTCQVYSNPFFILMKAQKN